MLHIMVMVGSLLAFSLIVAYAPKKVPKEESDAIFRRLVLWYMQRNDVHNNRRNING